MERLIEILHAYKKGATDLDQVLDFLRRLPFENLGFARVDHHRPLRRGYPEVVYGEDKDASQILHILQAMAATGTPLLVTRVHEEKAAQICAAMPDMQYEPKARVLYKKGPISEHAVAQRLPVQVLSAGSSDIPVAEEAAVTAEVLGQKVQRFYDVGVAGLHRLLHLLDELSKAAVYVVVAGMEGALPSVVAGLVKRPVIAVPTSIGYGASFRGLAPLLGMLNSCAPGVAVVNIDNGFGAGYLASMIADMANAWKHEDSAGSGTS
ncbi:nickel pincer cofactor biosynthesis protein LarB [Desulfosoma caldarium]|nr:nickel pincer cofactor biosynthesis protein LarB [Desulfosoma caldarium]